MAIMFLVLLKHPKRRSVYSSCLALFRDISKKYRISMYFCSKSQIIVQTIAEDSKTIQIHTIVVIQTL